MKYIEPIYCYTIEDLHNSKHRYKFYWGRPNKDREPKIADIETQEEAEQMCRKFAALYGGQWIYRLPTEPKEARDTLIGQAARDKAHANILAGPDTPGQRWLLRRNKGEKEQDKNHIAAAIDIIPF